LRVGALDWLAIILTVIGALNWGLIGLFSFNLVEFLFGSMTLLTRIVYILVGLSGLYLIFTASKLGADTRDEVRD
jgi:uncharacterized protein